MARQNHLWTYTQADAPVILSVPHSGTALSASVQNSLTDWALRLPDTDWHTDRLATAAAQSSAGQSACVLVARYSRYMVDLNRPRDDNPLYAVATTGLVPTIDFYGNSLYRSGREPDEQEINFRVREYWQGYHRKLRQEIENTKRKFGCCLLLDCHSIRSKVPRLFAGTLSNINIGTNDGVSASPLLSARINEVCEQSNYSFVFNGRFKGGFITRHYGVPHDGIHAVQIEIAQNTYMVEAEPWSLIPNKMDELINFIRKIILQMREFANDLPR